MKYKRWIVWSSALIFINLFVMTQYIEVTEEYYLLVLLMVTIGWSNIVILFSIYRISERYTLIKTTD